jgi:hypothetical protein
VGTTANGNSAVRAVNHLLTSLNELRHVAELGSTVRISEKNVLASHMPESMGHTAALATVPLQGHHPQNIVKLVLAAEIEDHIHRPVCAAIVDNQDLVCRLLLEKKKPHIRYESQFKGIDLLNGMAALRSGCAYVSWYHNQFTHN